MLTHQTLERGRLVVRVVVDVHVREAGKPFGQEVDEPLKREPLLGPVMRPECAELAIRGDDAEEVLQAAPGVVERVALNIEEDVAFGWSRQQLKPAPLDQRQQLEEVLASDPMPVLEFSLTAKPLEDLRALLGAKLDIGGREAFKRRDPGVGELLHPGAAHVRDKAQVVVLLPLPRAPC